MAVSIYGSGLQLSNSLNNTINQQQEGQNAIECTNTTKKGRGRTSGLGVAKKRKKSATGKLHVDISIDKMVAVGPGAANFVTEISIIVLKNAPFNVKKWKNIPEDIFNKIVSKVLCMMLLTLIIQHIIEKLFLILLKDYIEIIDIDFIDILTNTRQMK
ncbi:hypothetical protein QL285_010352 [Trifolium repens]|nr:hypothetical protein QL285_010352 [Trifolium repens]